MNWVEHRLLVLKHGHVPSAWRWDYICGTKCVQSNPLTARPCSEMCSVKCIVKISSQRVSSVCNQPVNQLLAGAVYFLTTPGRQHNSELISHGSVGSTGPQSAWDQLPLPDNSEGKSSLLAERAGDGQGLARDTMQRRLCNPPKVTFFHQTGHNISMKGVLSLMGDVTPDLGNATTSAAT